MFLNRKNRIPVAAAAVMLFLLSVHCARAQYPMYYPCRSDGGLLGYVDKSGEWAVQPMYDAVLYETNGGMYAVSAQGKWGLVGVSGQPLTEIVYDAAICEIDYTAHDYKACFAALRRKGKWAFVNVQGIFVTEFKYDEVLIMNGKYIIRVRDGKRMRSGVLDENGKEVWND